MIAYKFDHLWSEPQYESLLGGAVTCSEGFVTVFLKVPLACLGSMAAAVQHNSLGTLRKHFTKLSEQVAAPPGRQGCVTPAPCQRSTSSAPPLPPRRAAVMHLTKIAAVTASFAASKATEKM